MFGKTSNALIVIGLLVSPSLHAGMRTVSWDPSPGATEYHLYYGSGSGSANYTKVPVGSVTETTIELDDCTRWYFAVTAANAAGESGFSTEVDWLTPMSVDDFVLDDPGQPIHQGFQGGVTITGARFEPGAEIRLDHPGWICFDGATAEQCAEFLSNRRLAARLENLTVEDCNTITAWAAFESTKPGAAPTVGEYTLTVTSLDETSVSLNGAVEILLDPTRRDIDKSTYWTDNRIDGLDLGWITHESHDACISDVLCPNFQHRMDIDGDGWINGNDLELVVMDHFGLCWDTNPANSSGNPTWPWTAQACLSHPSETNTAE